MKILLADDDRRLHLVVKMWLERNGHEVTSVFNGSEALEKLEAEPFDGLITDVNMPLMKGMDLVKEVLQLPEKPELIIVLTSRCDMKEIEQDINSDLVHHFNKPFSPSALAELIEQLSQRKENQNESGKQTTIS
ncbi:MAG: response regulator [Sedimentisphaerales bacterium]|nr:response regulator [Sedimentisphaerales bacterium]